MDVDFSLTFPYHYIKRMLTKGQSNANQVVHFITKSVFSNFVSFIDLRIEMKI